MILQKLIIENFRGYPTKVFDFTSGKVYIAGENGEGKTSFREALKWLLTGRAIGLDAGGKGVDEAIRRWGAQPNDVVSVVGRFKQRSKADPEKATQLIVERRWEPDGSTLLMNEGAGDQGALCDVLGASMPIILASLDSTTFTRLKHVEAKQLLMEILNVQVAHNGDILTLAQLEARYQHAFDDRALTKKMLALHQVPPAPEFEPPDMAVLERGLETVRDDEKRLLVARAEQEGARTPLERELDAVQRQRAILDPLGTLSRDREDGIAKIAAINDRLERIGIQSDDLENIDPPPPGDATAVGNDLEPRLLFVVNAIEQASNQNPTKGCVIDGTIPCLTDAKAFGDAVKALKKEKRILETALEKHRERNAVRRNLREEEIRLQADRTRDLASLANVTERLGFLEEKKRRETALIEQLNAMPADHERAAALVTLQERIKKGEEVVRRARQLVLDQEKHDKAKRERDARVKTLETLEADVETYGPKGIRVAALEVKLSVFTDQINQFLSAYDWQMGFTLDPWRVTVNHRPLETYSNAEQIMLGAALQLAIASISGFGLAVIDSVDALDTKHRGPFTQVVVNAPIDQVFVLATRDKEQALPNVDGVQAIRL